MFDSMQFDRIFKYANGIEWYAQSFSQSRRWHQFYITNTFLAFILTHSCLPFQSVNDCYSKLFSLHKQKSNQKKNTLLINDFFFFLQCWDECTSSTSINKSILDTWSLSVQSMVRDNSLVSTNIAWTATNSPSDCLVTWEVSGGGLIGNLLTQSSNVELSLWPETKYRIQVTCKNKVSDRRIDFFFVVVLLLLLL